MIITPGLRPSNKANLLIFSKFHNPPTFTSLLKLAARTTSPHGLKEGCSDQTRCVRVDRTSARDEGGVYPPLRDTNSVHQFCSVSVAEPSSANYCGNPRNRKVGSSESQREILRIARVRSQGAKLPIRPEAIKSDSYGSERIAKGKELLSLCT